MAQPQQQPRGQGGNNTNPEPEALRNLIVNYIPTTIDEMQLRQLFEMYGPIEHIKIVTDRETRQSKGYGFVKYRFAFSAMHAIQYLSGYPLMNKRLKVAYANAAEAQKASTQVMTMNPYQQVQGMQPGIDQQAYMQQMAMMQQQQMMMAAAQQQQMQQMQAQQAQKAPGQ